MFQRDFGKYQHDYSICKLKDNSNSIAAKTSNLGVIRVPWDSIKTTYVFLEEQTNYKLLKDSSPEI
jgi:hypothetical protein